MNIKPDLVATAWCEKASVAVGVRWRCNLPEIPADSSRPVRVTFVGDVDSEVPQMTRVDLLAYRPSSRAKFVALYSR